MGRLLNLRVFLQLVLFASIFACKPVFDWENKFAPQRGVVLEVDQKTDPVFSEGIAQIEKTVSASSKTSPSLWKEIWLIGAWTSPQKACERIPQAFSFFEENQTSALRTLENRWFLLAAWECFLSTGNRQLLIEVVKRVEAPMQEDDLSDAFGKTITLDQEQNIYQLLLRAQTWRVLGYMHGVLNDRGASLFCETRFQRLRNRFQKYVHSEELRKNGNDLMILAHRWDVLSKKENATVHLEHWDWSQWQNQSRTEPQNRVVQVLRDDFGLKGQAFSLEFHPRRTCSSKPVLDIIGFHYQGSVLWLRLKGCGAQLDQATVNGKTDPLVEGMGILEVSAGVKGRQEILFELDPGSL